MTKGGPDIRYLFEPRGVAIVGASSDYGKIGYKVVENIVSGGYRGKIYPINPKGGELLGLNIYKSLEEIDREVDVAVISIPAKGVFGAVQACAKKAVKFLPIITSGFSETGNAEEERRIVAFARDNGMRVLGPNVFGIYSSQASLNATFGPKWVKEGKVAIITQSGALGIAMMGKSVVESVGLSAMVSVGNKSDIGETDLLRYLVGHPGTGLIMMYMEGVQQDEEFIETLRDATRKKPVVVIKSGRSRRGAMAVASHTGSLAGSDAVFDGIMRQCGVIRAENLQDAFNWCKFFAYSAQPRGENTVIITNGGGVGVMATDACEKYGVRLYDDLQSMAAAFGKVTPEFGSTKNPIDLTGQATPELYREALEAGLRDDKINSVIGLYCETAVFDADALKQLISEAYDKYSKKDKPIVFSVLGGEMVEDCITSQSNRGIPIFADVYEAVSCLGAVYGQYRRAGEAPEPVEEAQIDADAVEKVAADALEQGRHFLLPHEARAVMRAADIPMPRSMVARNIDEAVKAAEKIGFPVVMKVVSKDIIHKSDAGGVALDLENRAEAIDAYQAIMHNCRQHNPGAIIEGVEVDEMVASGTEVIVGARRDRGFGPVVMCGMGGIYVEIMKDVAFGAFPLSRREAMAMIKETKTYQLLLGARGEARKDIEGVINILIKMGTIIKRCAGISDIEINPLMVFESGVGVKAVDVRILLSKSQEAA